MRALPAVSVWSEWQIGVTPGRFLGTVPAGMATESWANSNGSLRSRQLIVHTYVFATGQSPTEDKASALSAFPCTPGAIVVPGSSAQVAGGKMATAVFGWVT
ncbi:MAG TPA: hypothetical protein VN957_16115 [Chthoniobacterales bacterium]|jgi:hypothetical protein|nr:hypothetical protein [Chthoniobacterales bacterium]